MLRYAQIADNSKDLLAMTGYTKQEFEALLPQFQRSYDEYLQEHTIEGYERVGQLPKPYRNSPLPTIEDKLLFILVSLKQNPTQTLHGYVFGMSQSNVNTWFHVLHTVLNHALDAHGVLPEREMTITSVTHADEVANDAERAVNTTGNSGAREGISTRDTPFLSMTERNVP